MKVLFRLLLLGMLGGLVLTACTQDDPVVWQPPRLTICTYNVEDMDFEAPPKDIAQNEFETRVLAKLAAEDKAFMLTCYTLYSGHYKIKGNLSNDRFARVVEMMKSVGYPINDTGYNRIAKYLKDCNVDVASFQEIQSGTVVGGLYADGTEASRGDEYIFSRTLQTNGYPMPYRAFSNNGGGRLDYVAFFSKYPMYDVSSIWPARMVDPATGKWYRGYRPALRVRMPYRGRDIWMYSMHLKSNAGGADEDNFGMRRAQAYHLATYMLQNHNLEKDYIILTGDMNTLTNDIHRGILGPTLGTIDYLCLRHDNPGNTNNDLCPMNLTILGGATNVRHPGVPTTGITYPSSDGFSDVTFDHIILSKAAKAAYVDGSIYIYEKGSRTALKDGASDHYPLQLTLEFPD